MGVPMTTWLKPLNNPKIHDAMRILPVLAVTFPFLLAGVSADEFTNLMRQVQLPSGVERDVQVEDEGEQFSPLSIDPGGARFELWAVRSDLSSSYLLDAKYVSTYTPVADLEIVTEDPYDVIPRTRADRPFDVLIQTHGMSDDPDAHQAARKVRLIRHVQSYGETNGEDIDRSQAQLLQSVYLENNAIHHFSFPVTAIPGADRSKVKGEERYSVFTLDHHQGEYQVDASQIASRFVQVWPVANATITGMDSGEVLRFSVPQLTIELNDLYPDSRTYLQLYPGLPSLGTTGTVVSGSALVHYAAVPKDKTLVLKEWDKMIDQDGPWTMEVLTSTPFGIDRLAYLNFTVNRSIEVRGSVTTVD